jgi:hypothetical protein
VKASYLVSAARRIHKHMQLEILRFNIILCCFVSSRETTLRDIIKALSTRRRRGGGGREANAVNDMDARSATAPRPKEEEEAAGGS